MERSAEKGLRLRASAVERRHDPLSFVVWDDARHDLGVLSRCVSEGACEIGWIAEAGAPQKKTSEALMDGSAKAEPWNRGS